eukprot:15457941-Alexandrium_andersonii.AAC.1
MLETPVATGANRLRAARALATSGALPRGAAGDSSCGSWLANECRGVAFGRPARSPKAARSRGAGGR